MSALAFTPKRSIVYQTFAHRSLRPLPEILTADVESSDNSRVLWDCKTSMSSVIFSPDGKRILTYRVGENTIRLYSAKSFKLITAFEGAPVGGVESAVFSFDGSLIATGSNEALVCLWDGYTGAFKEQLPREHTKPIYHIAFALSDSVIVSVDKKHQIMIWKVAPTRRAIHRRREMKGPMHTALVTRIATSPDSKFLATFSYDKTVKLWDIAARDVIGAPMLGSAEVVRGAFSTDGAKVIAGYSDGTVRIWAVENQAMIHCLETGIQRVYALAVSPKGNTVAIGGENLTLWDISTAEQLCIAEGQHVTCLHFNESGNSLVSGSSRDHATVWDIRHSGLGPDSDISISIKGTTLKGHTGYINDVASSPSGNLIASAGFDGTVRVWETDLIEDIDLDEFSSRPHQEVTNIALSNDGTRLVSVGESVSFQIWDFTTGEKVGSLFSSPEGKVRDVVFSFKRDLWASSHQNGNVCLWHHENDGLTPGMSVIHCEQGSITHIVFSRDKPYIVTASWNKSICVWELASRACVARYDYEYRPSRVAVSADGENMATVLLHEKEDKEDSRTYHLQSHKLVRGMPIKDEDAWKVSGVVDSVVFSPDGNTIVVSQRGNFKLFDSMNPLHPYASFEESLFQSSGIPTGWVPVFSVDGAYLFHWTWAFDVSKLSRGTQSKLTVLKPVKEDVRAHNPLSPLYVEGTTRSIYSMHWKKPMLLLPADVTVYESVAHKNTIALGSSDGRVFIIRFSEQYL